MKAMLAASQCPHCGHLFELRDGFGEMLPLAHCASCDSYYPLQQGSCRWCGTRPEGFRIAPYAVKSVGAVAFAGLIWGAWVVNRERDQIAPEAAVPIAEPQTDLTTQVDVGSDDFRAPVLASSEDTLSELTPVPPYLSEPPAADTVSLAMPEADTSVARLPTIAAPAIRTPATPKATVRQVRNSRWIGATARQWITVRARATHNSRVVASIGPDTRVQLGEERGDWRRIRMKGVSGWVDKRQF
jgi:hypothetical protein